jgi:hypothetical protein
LAAEPLNRGHRRIFPKYYAKRKSTRYQRVATEWLPTGKIGTLLLRKSVA